jgi:hypothetical protein
MGDATGPVTNYMSDHALIAQLDRVQPSEGYDPCSSQGKRARTLEHGCTAWCFSLTNNPLFVRRRSELLFRLGQQFYAAVAQWRRHLPCKQEHKHPGFESQSQHQTVSPERGRLGHS